MDKQDTNDSGNANPGMGLLGEFLKQKRIDKNYTLEKLSQKTKISVNILKAIEANDYGNMPSAAYIKGFVTSYVKVLGVPLDEAINKMEYTYLNVLGKPFPALNHTKNMATPISLAQMPLKKEDTPTPHDLIESGDSIIQSTKSILPVVIFGAIILLFIGGYKLISSVVESEVTDQKVKDLGPKIESSSALVKQPIKTEDPKKVETAPADAATKPVAGTEDKVEGKPLAELERNFPTVNFYNIKNKLFSVKTDAPENSDETILPKQIKDSLNSDMQNIYIRALDGSTWLSYKIDSNPIESVIINKDSDLLLQGNEIRIFLGNVNVTRIFYNNYLIETPTRTGVKSLVFPEESNEKFKLPLFPKAKDENLYTAEDYIKRMKLEQEESAKRKEVE